jgi:GNAT superfamily N-acetyltransferase
MTTTNLDSVHELSLAELLAFDAPPTWGAIDPRSAPDATFAAFEEGELRARCSCWWTSTPTLPGERVGVIGHFAATSATAARSVLDAACEKLRGTGVSIAIGPMDGSTWRRYRFVTSGSAEPPFMLEPENPASWPEWWALAGWAPHAHYFSAVNEELTHVDATVPAKAGRLAARGVTVRDFDAARAEAELHALHGVASRCFRDSYLYTPIGAHAFIELYRPVLPYVDSRLVSVAEHDGRTVGFCFCVPDMLERARTGSIESVVLKTFAVLPEFTGLGGVLAARADAVARDLGYKRMIHALMHERNERSRALSQRSGREIRRYALFERRLNR